MLAFCRFFNKLLIPAVILSIVILIIKSVKLKKINKLLEKKDNDLEK